MMGEIVGMAASLCLEHDADPRSVYANHLSELKSLMAIGVGNRPEPPPPPDWLSKAGPNHARTAAVSVSGSRDATANPVANLNDGIWDVLDNNGRWLSEESVPNWIQFEWDTPRTIGIVRILSGYCQSDHSLTGTVQDFHLEYYDGSTWQPVAGSLKTGNSEVDYAVFFSPIKTTAVRLVITRTPNNISRIWEVELYGPILKGAAAEWRRY